MTPRIGKEDIFEGLYREKFRSLARPYGEFISYERDRAAVDIGLHLTSEMEHSVTNTKIWFQLKGKRSKTLPLEIFKESSSVSLDIEIEHLKFWYASPEPIYLVVYIECADLFLAEEVRYIVDKQWKENILNPSTFRREQKTTRVRIPTNAVLNEDLWRKMVVHRSIRVDGPLFRGRPLGHRLDPLRCVLKTMVPSLFSEIVGKILTTHNYDIKEHLDSFPLFPSNQSSGDVFSLSYGTMGNTYEWVLQMMTEFGFSPSNRLRSEGQPFYVQGPCAILIHSKKVSHPCTQNLSNLAKRLVVNLDIKHLLVFVNSYLDPAYFGSFFGLLRDEGLECYPQDLGDLSYNLLTNTSVYLDYCDKLSWRIVSYLY